jgi:hypothetical protein
MPPICIVCQENPARAELRGLAQRLCARCSDSFDTCGAGRRSMPTLIDIVGWAAHRGRFFERRRLKARRYLLRRVFGDLRPKYNA